jgi:hypothetical protein
VADPARSPESRPHTRPRWVKVSVIVGILVLLVVILALTGVLGGQHGPGRHLPGGGRGDTRSPSATAEMTTVHPAARTTASDRATHATWRFAS